ncbi:MAG TPA: hypothetical protein VN611_09080 [Patescibacteria group bacterium]|nr:hypothetical protein [Patescibacteria group bacterium]
MEMTWIKPGRTTGMGSLPHEDGEVAMGLIARNMPHWPHWPQLPRGGQDQGMTVQYVQPLIKLGMLKVPPRKDPVFTRDEPGWDDKVLRFYELYLAFQEGDPEAEAFFALDEEAFPGIGLFLKDFSRRFPAAEGVKGHLTGPLTLGFQVKEERGRAAYYDDVLQDLLIKCLTVQGILQTRLLQQTGLPVLLFLDDPSLFFLGSSIFITLTREALIESLSAIYGPLREAGAKIGIHVCSEADWSLLFAMNPDVISFDAFEYFQSMALQAPGLQQYLAGGGKMAWGIVPTSEKVEPLTTESLITLFRQQCAELERRNVDVALLKNNVIWTPSCGTGAVPQPRSEKIYNLLGEFAASV